jgi:hypothetical protein
LAQLTLTFPYRTPPGLRKEKDQRKIPLYPLLNIKLYSEKCKALSFEGLLDSGADGLFLPKQIAEGLGLQKMEKIKTSGILKSELCYKTKVGFIIGRTKDRRIDFGMIDAAFPENESDIPILIGRDPLFKYFEITFMEYKDTPKVVLSQKKQIIK